MACSRVSKGILPLGRVLWRRAKCREPVSDERPTTDLVVPCVQVHVGLAWCLRQFQCYGRSLGLAAPAGLPVFLGAGEAAGLAGYSRVAAAFAKAQQFGLSASFLLVALVVLPALRGLVSLPVVLESFLPAGLDLGWVWLSAVPRLSGCAGGRAFRVVAFGPSCPCLSGSDYLPPAYAECYPA